MMQLWKIVLLLFFSINAFAITSIQMDKLESGQQILKVGHIDFPPFYLTDNTGMDAEIFQAVAAQAKIKNVKFIKYNDLPTLITALNSGDIDVIASGFLKTRERANDFLLSIPYYKKGGIGLLYKKEKSYKSLQDLNRYKLGTLTGSHPEIWLSQQNIAPVSVKTYENWPQLLKALDDGEIDVVISNFTVCRYAKVKNKNKYLDAQLTEVPMVYLMQKQNIELQNNLNFAIGMLWKNQKLYAIKEKYLKNLDIEPSKIE